ncbi:MAG: energy-coupled thiamine transporter ThiT [Clostridia bacterium]|nr:energy-coupled thiamine transporter ThiT [Clostridia bacterium]
MKKVVCLVLMLVLALLPMAIAETATVAPDATVEATAETSAEPEATAEVSAEETEAPAEEEEEESAAQRMFGDLTGMHWYTAAIVAVLLVMGLVISRSKKSKWTARRLSYAAMCIAIAFVLSCIKLYHAPQGGSTTPAAMLPLIMFALACGPVQGLTVGCAYGLLQLIEEPYVVHPLQLLCDYPLAYGAMALCCLACLIPEKHSYFRLPVAVVLGYFARLVMAVISGVVFFAEYAGDQNAFVYSVTYNLGYLAPETLIALVISLIPGMNRLVKTIAKKA